MIKTNSERKKIILICENCLSRNYSFFKSPSSNKKIELNKYCKQCEKHCLHKESR